MIGLKAKKKHKSMWNKQGLHKVRAAAVPPRQLKRPHSERVRVSQATINRWGVATIGVAVLSDKF